jgi:thiol:disulfide interchange protein DsbD
MAFRIMLLIALTPVVTAPAEAAVVRSPHLESQLVARELAAVPGELLTIGLWLRHAPESHSHWQNPGDVGVPTRIFLDLPAGFSASPIRWPVPERQVDGSRVGFGYGGTVVLPIEITVPPDFEGPTLTLRARADWLVCKLLCIPGNGSYDLTLPVATEARPDPRWAQVFAQAERRQPQQVDEPVAIAFKSDSVELKLPPELIEGTGRNWTFFPITTQVVANSVRARWRVREDGPVLVLPKSESYIGAPETFEFLLVNGDRALEFRAPARSQSATRAQPAESAPPALPIALGFALLGGLTLNLMPCVFPVLFLTIAGVIASSRNRALLRRHGLLYTAGVIASFLAMAAILLLLRESGATPAWGFRLQSPAFVAALVLLFFILALNFAGLIEFRGRFALLSRELALGHGDWGAVLTGVLAGMVASACTTPFTALALASAASQPVPTALTIFAVLGLGLAAPILMLGVAPRLARRLPRPGAWMLQLQRWLAWPLLLATVWLLWVFREQTSLLAAALLLAAMSAVGFGLRIRRQPPARF